MSNLSDDDVIDVCCVAVNILAKDGKVVMPDSSQDEYTREAKKCDKLGDKIGVSIIKHLEKRFVMVPCEEWRQILKLRKLAKLIDEIEDYRHVS